MVYESFELAGFAPVADSHAFTKAGLANTRTVPDFV